MKKLKTAKFFTEGKKVKKVKVLDKKGLKQIKGGIIVEDMC